MSSKVRSLANYCLDLRFSRYAENVMFSRKCVVPLLNKSVPDSCLSLSSISIGRGCACHLYREGFTIEANAIDQLVQSTHADIRQILNMLQSWNVTRNTMSYDQSKRLYVTPIGTIAYFVVRTRPKRTLIWGHLIWRIATSTTPFSAACRLPIRWNCISMITNCYRRSFRYMIRDQHR